jgi:hypothetical protein
MSAATETAVNAELDTATEERVASLFLAEYETPDGCVNAAKKLRDAGYQKFDAHTP